ncbi:MAG TPA: nuclear transport factor 2 family protein [Thermoanaerobaculia bacterium]|nr:nuclear transport factor 2 family protein [Thermoanaerobaculia bacterium]
MPRTRSLATLLPLLVVALLVVPALVAELGAQEAGEPEAAVDAFHRALRSGDRDAALDALSPEVTVFESGGAELSREEYASHHLGGDMAFSAAVHTEVTARWTGGEGDTAWVLSRTATRGNYRDREIDSRGVETMLLRRLDGGWKIVHVHWSSRSAPEP